MGKKSSLKDIHRLVKIEVTFELFNNEPFTLFAKKKRSRERNVFKVAPTHLVIRDILEKKLMYYLLKRSVAPVFDEYVQEVYRMLKEELAIFPPFGLNFERDADKNLISDVLELSQVYENKNSKERDLVSLGYIAIKSLKFTH